MLFIDNSRYFNHSSILCIVTESLQGASLSSMTAGGGEVLGKQLWQNHGAVVMAVRRPG